MPRVKTRALNREAETLGRVPQCIPGQQLPLSGARECPPQRSPSLNRAPGAPASLLTWALQPPSPWALWPARGFAAAWEVSPLAAGRAGGGQSYPSTRERSPASRSERLKLEGWRWCSSLFWAVSLPISVCLSLFVLSLLGPSGGEQGWTVGLEVAWWWNLKTRNPSVGILEF